MYRGGGKDGPRGAGNCAGNGALIPCREAEIRNGGSPMRILRIRRGFQADHSSSSYLFYAVDHPVNAEGQKVAHRFSSRADVDERSARYLKWGESDLQLGAYKALLGEHFDVMASESYDWWTLMIAVPKTPATIAILKPFHDARGYDNQGVDVEDYGSRLVVTVLCAFDGNGVEFSSQREDPHDRLVTLLAKVRAELMEGNTSFLEAVASFYGADEDEEDEGEEGELPGEPQPERYGDMTKAELQQECVALGITYRSSWSKGQLRDALAKASTDSAAPKTKGKTRPPKLSKAAKEIVDNLVSV